MKKDYLDIIEKCLNTYDEDRIDAFIESVEKDGLTEHGFPRLGVNIGTLMANGRCFEYMDVFCKIMDLYCLWFPRVTDECDKAGNEFAVREICCVLMDLRGKGVIEDSRLDGWKALIGELDPWQNYYKVVRDPMVPENNWALFAAVSEYLRAKYCNKDTMDFVDRQLGNQVLALDENGMFKDPHNPILYDYMARTLFMSLLLWGYDGVHRQTIEDAMERSADITLHMISTTGEMPFGGRSIQFVHNEAIIASICEMYATYYARKGDLHRASLFKGGAVRATDNLKEHLDAEYVYHTKNKYPRDSMIGCEGYGYFNKYMITVASDIYFGLCFADDSIEPAFNTHNYVVSTGEAFHKTFIRQGDYFLEYDTNADFNYDANGLGRVHRRGCSSYVCLSVPFPSGNGYQTEAKNSRPMAIGMEGSSESGYRLVTTRVEEDAVGVTFSTAVGTEECVVTDRGVDITYSAGGVMVPVFAFDGKNGTLITHKENTITVSHEGSVCTYTSNGSFEEDYEMFYNRNGRYRVYKTAGNKLHIDIKRG